MILAKLGLDRPKATVRVIDAQSPCRRPVTAIVARLRIGEALKVGWRNRARRSSLATRRSTGTTPSRIRRCARWPATSASRSPGTKFRQVASTARLSVRPSSRSRCRSSVVNRRRRLKSASLSRRDMRVAGLAQVGRDPLVVAQLGDHLVRLVVPGPLLELETQPGQLFLEDAAALHVVGDDRPRRAIDEQQDRALVRARASAPGRRRR